MAEENKPKRFLISDEVEANVFRRDITYEECQKRYSEWADYYDETLDEKPKVYNVLMMYEQGMDKLFSDKSGRRCLDIGAGTGLTGERLRNVGYTDFDGVEPNEKMAAGLKQRGIYKNIVVQPIGGDKPLDIPDNTYDAVACGGGFAAGHIPCSAIPEIFRLLKPGGYFLNCVREEFLYDVPDYKDKLIPMLNELEEKGQIKNIEWTIYPHHYIEKTGVRWVYQKL